MGSFKITKVHQSWQWVVDTVRRKYSPCEETTTAIAKTKEALQMNRLCVAGLLGILLVLAWVLFPVVVSAEVRLTVQPVFFMPSDTDSYSKGDMDRHADLLFAHLNLAREHWKRILGTDTFEITREGARVYYARKPGSWFILYLTERYRRRAPHAERTL